MSGSVPAAPATRAWIAVLAALAASWGATAGAQTSLGSQRVGTSSATFLKVPLDARAAAMAGAIVADVSGPAAMFANPAGLGLDHERALLASAVRPPPPSRSRMRTSPWA
jgi:hypothetical protein